MRVTLNTHEQKLFGEFFDQMRKDSWGINEARKVAMNLLCVHLTNCADTVSDLRRVIQLMLAKDKW